MTISASDSHNLGKYIIGAYPADIHIKTNKLRAYMFTILFVSLCHVTIYVNSASCCQENIDAKNLSGVSNS